MVWAEITVAALAGTLFYGTVTLVERWVTYWQSIAETITTLERRIPMKNQILAGAASLALCGAPALAGSQLMGSPLDEITLQLKWVTQAQFAGYYVALEKGFYEDENLDVTIKPGGPDIAPTQVIAGGGCGCDG